MCCELPWRGRGGAQLNALRAVAVSLRAATIPVMHREHWGYVGAVGLLLPPVGNGDQKLPPGFQHLPVLAQRFSQLVLWGHQEVMGWGAPSPCAGVVGGIFCQVGTALAAGAYPCLSHWRWGN